MALYFNSPAPGLILPEGANYPIAGAAWSAANRAVFVRFNLADPGVYRYFNYRVTTQAGNVQYGVVRLAGTELTDYTRVMNSGVIACPAAGNQRASLGATLLSPGRYAAFLWASSTSFETPSTSGVSAQAVRVAGSHDGLASGVGATGTLTWSDQYLTVSLEADV